MCMARDALVAAVTTPVIVRRRSIILAAFNVHKLEPRWPKMTPLALYEYCFCNLHDRTTK